MSQTHAVIQGTLQADGTLLLDEKPNLLPGRVRVIVEPIIDLPTDDPFWQQMMEIWDSLRVAGHQPRTREEIDAELRTLDDDAEAEMQATERLHEECRQAAPEPQRHPQ
jgi:hypothetical protein